MLSDVTMGQIFTPASPSCTGSIRALKMCLTVYFIVLNFLLEELLSRSARRFL